MDPIEAEFQRVLERLKTKHEERHGAGSFAQSVAKGRIIMAKKAHELTPEERALFEAPAPAKQH